jgi:hypothetical protein
MNRGWAQLAVGVASARAFEQENHSVWALQKDVKVNDDAVPIRGEGTFPVATGPLRRAEILIAIHPRRA